jgi:GNAT superfamily N-acetyltransferase
LIVFFGMKCVLSRNSDKAIHFSRAARLSLLDALEQAVDAFLSQIGLRKARPLSIWHLSRNLEAWKNGMTNMPRIEQAQSAAEIEMVRGLFREYADSLGVDLSFQNFERELRELPGAYAPPRGRLFLAYHLGANRGKQVAGCGALRPLSPETCEMKRLYVRREFRGLGVGRSLAEALVAAAQEIGYRAMRLDTLPAMQEAHALYLGMKFKEIPAYTHNPISGTRFLELDLSRLHANEPERQDDVPKQTNS